jgi:hypothetical protein
MVSGEVDSPDYASLVDLSPPEAQRGEKDLFSVKNSHCYFGFMRVRLIGYISY